MILWIQALKYALNEKFKNIETWSRDSVFVAAISISDIKDKRVPANRNVFHILKKFCQII